MGPDPFSLPSFGSTSASQNSTMLDQAVGQAAPYATQWHGILPGPSATQVLPSSALPSAPKSQGVISGFLHWLGGTASEIGHIAGSVAGWLGKETVNMVEAPVKFSYDFGTGAIRTFEESSQVNHLLQQQQNLDKMWKSGQISNDQYKQELASIMQQHEQLDNATKITQQRLQNSKIEGINTTTDLVMLATAGAGSVLAGAGEKAASAYLTSAGTENFFRYAEAAINKVATDPAVFDALPSTAKIALQKATAEVVANSSGMSAAQIGRAAAVNLAIKYPFYYGMLSPTADSIYTDLQSKKYGSAVGQLAFNAALLLSGGPIGEALKYGGKFVKAVSDRVFGAGSFIDTLSKGIGNGDPAGLANAVMKLPVEQRADVTRQLSALEATNLAATGKDSTAAAIRVLKGMESYEGLSMTQFTHQEALDNMVNFAKAQRLVDETARANGLSKVTVGRLDARDLAEISSAVAPSLDAGKDTAHNAFDGLVQENMATKAWANNDNFIRQVHNLINKYDSSAAIDGAIRGIKASFKVRGFPEKEAQQLAKMGYIPITPVNLEAPFREGTGKLTTQFAASDDFFTHAVQPLPVLGFMGNALTRMGLSPLASSQRVYQIFNDALTQNLKDSKIMPSFVGESENSGADTLIKKLSSYVNEPTRRGIWNKTPITDLRMLTIKDIETALGISAKDARGVQTAITKSYLQVPLAVRGLGDKAVDFTYKGGAGAFARRYFRLQGAARFSFNPFFQYLRVVPKTEILSTAEGGGFISSIFKGQVGDLGKIRTELRSQGFLDEAGALHSGNVLSGGEATDFAGSVGRNINHKLLPMQERSIAGLVGAEAKRMGVDVPTYLREFPQQTRDTIQAIAGYDRNSSLLNSPLMKTLNLAFFPLRFETKVAQIMTRGLAKTSLLTQVSVINGLLHAHQWLNSPEGQAWYSHNADAIGFFEYITPVAELNQVFEALLPGHDHSLGNFGELGGLPFGWIPMILDAEGLTNFNQPGVDASTGAIYSQYIPKTNRGQVAIAIQDFLGTLFSYPGAEIGLKSKSSITRSAALGIVGGSKKTDLQLSTPPASSLSLQQQNFIQGIKNANPNNPQINPNPLIDPATGKQRQQFGSPNKAVSGTTVPTTAMPPTSNSNSGSSSGSKGRKLKKGQYIPALLPGQTKHGVI